VGIAITTSIEADRTTALIRLMTWLSPAFPIGAFAYSGGLEKAVEDGRVDDEASLFGWLEALIDHGVLKTDATLFSLSYRAGDDEEALWRTAELALALTGSSERHSETVSLGVAFMDAAAVWDHPLAETVRARIDGKLAYPVAAGAVAGAHNVGLEAGIAAFVHACLSQLVSVAIRCGVIGQRQGVAILASLEAKVTATARSIAICTEDDLGTAAFMAEICSLRHETQASRLFRS
jgi:urease accessory protein